MPKRASEDDFWLVRWTDYRWNDPDHSYGVFEHSFQFLLPSYEEARKLLLAMSIDQLQENAQGGDEASIVYADRDGNTQGIMRGWYPLKGDVIQVFIEYSNPRGLIRDSTGEIVCAKNYLGGVAYTPRYHKIFTELDTSAYSYEVECEDGVDLGKALVRTTRSVKVLRPND